MFHARNVYSISRAMTEIPQFKEEGERKLVEAKKLLAGFCKADGMTSLAEDTGFEVFDLLVRIIER